MREIARPAAASGRHRDGGDGQGARADDPPGEIPALARRGRSGHHVAMLEPYVLSLALLVLALLAVGAWYGIGPERMLGWFGSPDLGAIDFAIFGRSKTPNDAFAAPAGHERAEALAPEIVSPVYEATPAALHAAVLAAFETMGDADLVDEDPNRLYSRHVARTPRMRWPDTIDVQVIPIGAGRVSLLVYSRAKFGMRDFGVNRARIAALLAELGRGVRVAR